MKLFSISKIFADNLYDFSSDNSVKQIKEKFSEFLKYINWQDIILSQKSKFPPNSFLKLICFSNFKIVEL